MSLAVKAARAGAGDPGLFGSLLSVAKLVPGPIGAVASGVQRLTGGGGETREQRQLRQRAERITAQRNARLAQGKNVAPLPADVARFMGGSNMPVPQIPRPGVTGAIQRFLPGGQTGMMPAPAGKPSGYHLNKTDYFLKDGTFVPAGSKWVKNRRRNPLNPRAASKAIGRIESLKKATKRFNRITVRSKKC